MSISTGAGVIKAIVFLGVFVGLVIGVTPPIEESPLVRTCVVVASGPGEWGAGMVSIAPYVSLFVQPISQIDLAQLRPFPRLVIQVCGEGK